MENWKNIPGYDGKYKISNLGNVKSFKRIEEGKLLKPLKTTYGYYGIILYQDSKYKNFLVHRLVAQAFILNPENKPQINHIDGNKLNNSIENLEWCTHSENMVHRSNVLGYKGPCLGKFGKDSHLSKKINQFTKEGQFIRKWHSISDARKELGIINIGLCCNGILKTAGGFIWKFL